VCDRGVAALLDALRSSNPRDAWVGFLESYSPVLYQTARACTLDEDAAADCYLHICEQLARNGFRRLLKFKLEGRASFITWLRVVARNLCIDWHRSRSGRHRPFKSLQHLSQLELEVYNCRFNRGFSQEETLQQLESTFPGVSLSELAIIDERLHRCLSSHQQPNTGFTPGQIGNRRPHLSWLLVTEWLPTAAMTGTLTQFPPAMTRMGIPSRALQSAASFTSPRRAPGIARAIRTRATTISGSIST